MTSPFAHLQHLNSQIQHCAPELLPALLSDYRIALWNLLQQDPNTYAHSWQLIEIAGEGVLRYQAGDAEALANVRALVSSATQGLGME